MIRFRYVDPHANLLFSPLAVSFCSRIRDPTRRRSCLNSKRARRLPLPLPHLEVPNHHLVDLADWRISSQVTLEVRPQLLAC